MNAKLTAKDEKNIEKYMKKLGLSRDDAIQLVLDDKDVESGKNLYPLSAEQEKVSKTARSVNDSPKIYTFGKKEKKTDAEKKNITDNLIKTIESIKGQIVEVINPEREFTFKVNDTLYKIVLSKPRVKK